MSIEEGFDDFQQFLSKCERIFRKGDVPRAGFLRNDYLHVRTYRTYLWLFLGFVYIVATSNRYLEEYIILSYKHAVNYDWTPHCIK